MTWYIWGFWIKSMGNSLRYSSFRADWSSSSSSQIPYHLQKGNICLDNTPQQYHAFCKARSTPPSPWTPEGMDSRCRLSPTLFWTWSKQFRSWHVPSYQCGCRRTHLAIRTFPRCCSSKKSFVRKLWLFRNRIHLLNQQTSRLHQLHLQATTQLLHRWCSYPLQPMVMTFKCF